jgi:hypothetical protein
VAEEMVFDDVDRVAIPVTIAGVKYVLLEASEEASCKFRNALLRCTRPGPDGKPTSYDGVADTESLLVSLCLYAADDVGNVRTGRDGRPDPRHLVPLATLRSWPARVVRELARKAQEVSGLGGGPAEAGTPPAAGADAETPRNGEADGEAEAAKNSPGATTTT